MKDPGSPDIAKLPGTQARTADQECDRFEAAWRAGQRPQIEEYLAGQLEESGAALLHELILLEVDYRRRAGEHPQAEEFLARFPAIDPVWIQDALTDHAHAAQRTQDGLGATHGFGTAAPNTAGGPMPAVDGYEILAELGRGGMGIVYKARDWRLGRFVALKMILSGRHASPEDLSRFRTEAAAIARLQHPHIVQIFEFGDQDKLPYFALEYCADGGLDKAAAGTPLPPRDAAELVEKLARAIHYAHQQGVVHRDLKPANVLLTFAADKDDTSVNITMDGVKLRVVPKITDFGLARTLDAEGQTISGAVLGTPSYMAPEQASGQTKEIGPAVDVYALGAILYELLTGRPPFKAATPHETVSQVIANEPASVRELQSGVPVDLETICLKCLQKNPERRYEGALNLAEDLRHFQAGEPIAARPVGSLERAWRWCRRNPVVAGLEAAVMVLLIMGTAVAAGLAVRMYQHAERADEATGRALFQAKVAESNALTAAREEERARNEERTTRRFFYAAQMSLIAENWEKGDALEVQEMLAKLVPHPGQEDLRGPEWHYFWSLIHGYRLSIGGESCPCHSIAFLDGGMLATGGPGALRLWDPSSGEAKSVLASNPDTQYELRSSGALIVVLGRIQESLTWWTLMGDELKPLFQTRLASDDQLAGWAVAPDGKALAFSARPEGGILRLRVWDVESGRERFAKDNQTIPLDFAPDGAVLAVGVSSAAPQKTRMEAPIRLLNAVTGAEEAKLEGPLSDTRAGVFSADGRLLITGSRDGRVRTWDVHGKKLKGWSSYQDWADAVALSPDGKTVATGPGYGSAPITLLDLAANKRRELWGHLSTVRRLAFAQDGNTLAAACDDGTVKLWDVAPAAPKDARVPDAPADSTVLALAFSPDSRTLVSAGADHTLKVWDPDGRCERAVLRGHVDQVNAVAFSPDGRRFASGSADGTVRLWQGSTGQNEAVFQEPAPVTEVAFVRHGESLIAATWGAGVRIRKVPSGEELPSPKGCHPMPTTMRPMLAG